MIIIGYNDNNVGIMTINYNYNINMIMIIILIMIMIMIKLLIFNHDDDDTSILCHRKWIKIKQITITILLYTRYYILIMSNRVMLYKSLLLISVVINICVISVFTLICW